MAINTNYYNYGNYSSYLYGSSYTNSSSSVQNLLPYSSSSSRSYERNLAKQVSETVQNFISSAKINSFNLKAALDKLSGNNNTGTSSFIIKTAESGNEDVLSVKAVDSTKSFGALNSSIKVTQMAETQKNTGISLSANAFAIETGFEEGSQSIQLDVGKKSYTIDFSVLSTDTNIMVQQKIADSINSQNTGVKASVVHDTESDTSSLILESADTGVNSDGDLKFTLSSLSGNAIEQTGIDAVSRSAQNAVYSVNGGETRTSKTNDADIGNGITVTFKSEGEATVTPIRDTSEAVSNIKDMVEYFNNLLEATQTNASDKRTNALYEQLSGMTKSYSSALSRVGIEVNSGGYLSINETKLNSAAENGNLETFISGDKGKNYGFANKLSQISDKVDKNTLNYATISFVSSGEINFTPYQLTRYSAYENTGLLLSMIV